MSDCPRCGPSASPVITRGAVSVCGCGATHTEGRHARYADLETLSDADVAALKQQLGRVRPHVKRSRA